jgi:putative ABC transport system substrate-binding protein
MSFNRLRRREFVAMLGGAAAAWPLAARAQGERMRRVGVLSAQPESEADEQARLGAFRQRLAALGWVEGRNLQIDVRWQAADSEQRARASAAAILSLAPDLIVPGNTIIADAVLQESRSIPLLLLGITDPVETGLVASYARPGGNITGFTNYETQQAPKWLQLLKEIAPGTTSAMIMMQARNRGSATYLRAIESAAPSLGVRIVAGEIEMNNTAGIEHAIGSLAGQPNSGLVVLPGPIRAYSELIAAQALRHRLPAVYPLRVYTDSGGLLSYGVDLVDIYRRGAVYADRILRGEKPGNLPIQAPTKFELVLNVKTARALGIDVPLSLLIRVDDVIE